MSRSKGCVIDGRLLWIESDEHDIALALMITVAERLAFVPTAWVDEWRIHASVADLAFSTAEEPTVEEREVLACVIVLARELATRRGDATREEVKSWVVGDGLLVASGGLRADRIDAQRIVAVFDSFLACLRFGLERASVRSAILESATLEVRRVRLRSGIGWVDFRAATFVPPSDGDEFAVAVRPTPEARSTYVVEVPEPVVVVTQSDDEESIGHEEREATARLVGTNIVFVCSSRLGFVVVRCGTPDYSATAAATAVAILQTSGSWDESNPIVVDVAGTFVAVSVFREPAGGWLARSRIVGRRSSG